jgi:phage gp46-like protein
MDLALIYNPALQAFDIAVDGADLAADDTFSSAAVVSLLNDRQVEAYEVKPGEDRRGWWADAYATNNHKTGSRLWLLEREKQLPSVVQRCKQYCEEAMQWFVDDGLAQAISVTAFVARRGVLAAIIRFEINGNSRTLRVEFDESTQVWRLAGEAFNAV